MISIPGRKTYDSNIPRETYYDYDERIPDENYKSIQSLINIGPDGTADLNILNKYKNNKLIPKGFKQYDIKKIELIPIGSSMRFLKIDNTWKSGGFITEINRSNTIYNDNNKLVKDNNNKLYILYKAYNNKIYSLQEDDIKELWIKIHKKSINNVIKYKKPNMITNYPVYIKNEIVYYGKDEYSRKRFMDSQKYKKALLDGFKFI